MTTGTHSRWFAAGGLSLALILSACGTEARPAATSEDQQTVSIVDAQQRTVAVPVKPEKVVVTDWSAIRTLNDLGVEVDAVPTPNGSLPADLAKYADAKYPKVGTLFEPDYEAINELEPDLVVVGSRSGTPEVLSELTKITPNVIDMSTRFDNPADQVAATERRVGQLASIFGVEAEATRQLSEIKESIAEVKSQAQTAKLLAMFVQVSGGKASAYGPSSRFGLIYDGFGLTDTGAPIDDEGSHGEEVGQEFFAKYNPGAILVLDRGKVVGESAKPALEVLNNDLVNRTDAAKNQRVSEVDGFSWYLATAAPSSLRQMVTDVKRVL